MAVKTENAPKRLHRVISGRIFGGVAAGLADYFDLDVMIIRLVFVLLAIFGGTGFPLYLVLWVILPADSVTSGPQAIKDNLADLKTHAQSIGSQMRQYSRPGQPKSLFAFVLILVGVMLLLQNLGWLRMDRFWPLLLVFLGVAILVRE